MDIFLNKYWHGIIGVLAVLLCIFSLGFDWYPQFPSMCIILGIVLVILFDTLDPIPALRRHDWVRLYEDIRREKVSIGRGFLFLHTKLIFPTLFTIYLLLLIVQKVKIVPSDWQSYATSAIETLQLLWVTLGSAILANFTGLKDTAYEVEHNSPLVNSLTLVLVGLLSYGGMWAIFVEIEKIGRVAYFVSLSVGILIALVSCMILTEPDEENERGANDQK